MDSDGLRCIWMDSDVFGWTQMDSDGLRQTLVDSDIFGWTQMSVFEWIQMDLIEQTQRKNDSNVLL